jgi:flagellar basal-body rod modification protein FlgD
MYVQSLANTLPPAVAAQANTASGSTSTATQTAVSSESTFLQLLVTELKSQDPTSPMDPTQMVGQMFSMNQLNSLLSIQQILQNAFPAAAGVATASSNANIAPQSTTGVQ